MYAAGVIEDRLIAEKTPESFRPGLRHQGGRRAGAAGRARGTARTGPRFAVLFGSISAALGNRGQADYAAANDALESLGAPLAGRTGRRGLTVHWGPWARPGTHGGMVTPELMREYARRGIELIDPEEGALSLLRELAWGDRSRRTPSSTPRRAGDRRWTDTGRPRWPSSGWRSLLPGAPDLDTYWRNLVGGVDAITEVPAGRWDAEFYDPRGGGGAPTGLLPPRRVRRRAAEVDVDPVRHHAELGAPAPSPTS